MATLNKVLGPSRHQQHAATAGAAQQQQKQQQQQQLLQQSECCDMQDKAATYASRQAPMPA
jgi:hypothetical protein